MSLRSIAFCEAWPRPVCLSRRGTNIRKYARVRNAAVRYSGVDAERREIHGEALAFCRVGKYAAQRRTGETTCPTTLGNEIFEFFAANPEESEIFNDAMSAMSAMSAPAIVEAYDFSGVETLADIAGGHGLLLSQILKANQGLKGILFDLEHVIAGAGETFQREGVADRVATATGDFFKEVPTADAYIMKHIIHDWDDDRAVQIMKAIHKAMPDNGRMLVVEMVVPEGNEPHPSKVLDLEMLTLPGGVERTEKEFRNLFESAGFKLSHVIPTRSAFSILEGVKA